MTEALNLRAQPTGQCRFDVARSGGGYATVAIDRGEDPKRIIYFRFGQAIGTASSEAEGEVTFDSHQVEDLHFIRVGPERYEIPDAVIFGG